jgi:hypothetical protein
MIIPASLAGRCANGHERDKGQVVHAVVGLENHHGQVTFTAKSLCGKTYGARSAGWTDSRHLAINCPKCLKKMPPPKVVIELGYYDVSRKSNQFEPIFPKKWSCNGIDRDDVECQAIEINPGSNLVSKSKLNTRFWSNKRLHDLLNHWSSPGDVWQFPDNNNIICIWAEEDNESNEPMGFVSFRVSITKEIDQDEGGDIEGIISISIDLAWVRPDKRGLGGVVAKHLATHLIYYLQECYPHNLIGPGENWSFIYGAEYYSKGGKSFSKLIENHIQYISDEKLWPGFSSIECEAGW